MRPGSGAGQSASSGPDGQTVIVELAGVEPDSLPRLERLQGVVSAGHAPATEIVTLTVTERDSDAVLRELLRWDGVHVRAVRP